jgi:hypothetical protein
MPPEPVAGPVAEPIAGPVVLRVQLRPTARSTARSTGPQGAPQRPPQPSPCPTRRPAYVARLLALGHLLRALLDRGEVESVGELARRLHVSQPRISQLVALTYLAPCIQAEIAALEAVDGKEPMSERPLRVVLRVVGWKAQWQAWRGGWRDTFDGEPHHPKG